jgi:hypothetical protein
MSKNKDVLELKEKFRSDSLLLGVELNKVEEK